MPPTAMRIEKGQISCVFLLFYSHNPVFDTLPTETLVVGKWLNSQWQQFLKSRSPYAAGHLDVASFVEK